MGTIAITGERIWDGEGFSAGTILIEDGIVRERGAFVGLPAGIRVINAGSHEVLPGLVDVHVHLREPGYSYKVPGPPRAADSPRCAPCRISIRCRTAARLSTCSWT